MAISDLRIVSLLPAATEIAWTVGLGDELVGRSHECDWLVEALALPALTRPQSDPTASSWEIHEAVGEAMAGTTGTSSALFALDIDGFAALRPDLILTQSTCDVCAITGDEVTAAVRRSRHHARIVSLSATTLPGLCTDILAVGASTGTLPRARELVARQQARDVWLPAV